MRARLTALRFETGVAARRQAPPTKAVFPFPHSAYVRALCACFMCASLPSFFPNKSFALLRFLYFPKRPIITRSTTTDVRPKSALNKPLYRRKHEKITDGDDDGDGDSNRRHVGRRGQTNGRRRLVRLVVALCFLVGAMASMISTILMVGLLAFAAMFIYRMLRRKQDGAVAKPAFAGPAASYTPEIGSRFEPRNEPWHPAALQSAQPAASSHVLPQTPWGVPSDFDTTGFLRHAKTYFIRLQAAWDKADVGDIREFTTPQMFAELKMLIQERGASPNMTDVVTLDAQLLGMETHADEYLASVQFSGTIRESEHGAAEPFTEVWNLSKPISSHGGWVLAGIQQLS